MEPGVSIMPKGEVTSHDGAVGAGGLMRVARRAGHRAGLRAGPRPSASLPPFPTLYALLLQLEANASNLIFVVVLEALATRSHEERALKLGNPNSAL